MGRASAIWRQEEVHGESFRDKKLVALCYGSADAFPRLISMNENECKRLVDGKREMKS